MKLTTSSILMALGLMACSGTWAGDWGNWRGPNYDGSTEACQLPSAWSMTDNVAWSVDLPGSSAATPAVIGDKVFVSSIQDGTLDLLAICLDRATGKLLWSQVCGSGFGGDNRSNKSSPSPVADSEKVIFYFGSGDLVALDHDGKVLWRRNIQEDYGKYAFQWTYSSSPLLYGGKLYIPMMQRDVYPHGGGDTRKNIPSFLLALNPETGDTLWSVDRPTAAVAESREAFTTPVPMTLNGQTQILLTGGDCVTGHDPETGKELWRWGTWNPQKIGHWRLVPSPVSGAGVVLACTPKGGPVYAVKAGLTGDYSGKDEEAIAWATPERKITTDVCTPLFYQGLFYILDGDRKIMTCVDPKTGEAVWSETLDTRSIFRASPTAGDGKIYCVNHAGEVFVLKAGRTFEVLNKIVMAERDDAVRSSVVIAHGNLFIRTSTKLFCIGKS